jgi:hypothetical protein
MPDFDQAAWQARLDSRFPHGALCVSGWRSRYQTVFPVSWLHVTAVEEGMPVVRMAVLGGSKVLGPWLVEQYQLLADPPGCARVVFADGSVMLWNSRVPAGLIHAHHRIAAELRELASAGKL